MLVTKPEPCQSWAVQAFERLETVFDLETFGSPDRANQPPVVLLQKVLPDFPVNPSLQLLLLPIELFARIRKRHFFYILTRDLPTVKNR